MTPQEIMALAPVIPVVAVEQVDDAVPLARALLAGGLPVIEITLRTPAALECIAAVRREIPGIVVGAGTVLNAHQLEDAVAAGAQFSVSPGATKTLVSAHQGAGVPWLPGAATVSDCLALRAAGFPCQKFFPAEASGGRAWLASVAPVVPDVMFCPTGGIKPETATSYLSLPNVATVGGSWIAPAAVIASGDFSSIEAAAREAATLGGGAD